MALALKLPAVEQSLDENNKVIRKETTIDVTIETSVFAHLKWEEQFQKTMGVDLTTYAERVIKLKNDPDALKANFLSVLKLLYCYIDSPTLPTFREFAKYLDLTIAEKVLTSLMIILEEIEKTVSKN